MRTLREAIKELQRDRRPLVIDHVNGFRQIGSASERPIIFVTANTQPSTSAWPIGEFGRPHSASRNH